MGKRRRELPLSLSTLLMLASACSAGAQSVSPADDAYHYRYWADGQNDANYTEWWYFNLWDAQRGLRAVFTYFVTDPGNLTGLGMAKVTAVAYTASGIVTENDTYPAASFSAAYDQAEVRIAANSVQVIDANTYRIAGSIRDGRLSWDLMYVRQADPWFAADRLGIGQFSWEQMSWLIYMPRADIKGQVVLDGKVYVINGNGYHDHNWGEWIYTSSLWNWAQYSEPGFTLALGDFIGKPAGGLGVEWAGGRTVFTKEQYELRHTRWTFDSTNRVWYPAETELYAGNESVRLILAVEATEIDPISAGVPFPFPNPIVYEQTARYQGRLCKKHGKGQWEPALWFDGSGFKEYTALQFGLGNPVSPPAAAPIIAERSRQGLTCSPVKREVP